MPVPLLIAAGAGGVLGAKALVGLGIAGGTAIGVSIAAAWRFLFGSSEDEVNQDEKKKIEKEQQKRKETREACLDEVVSETKHHTGNLRHRTSTHTHRMEQATEALAFESALWNQEGQRLQQLILQLRAVIGEREHQLQQITQQLQAQFNALPPSVDNLNQSQWLLAERQNDLTSMINLLWPILQQLEARNQDWLKLTQQIQGLESTNMRNEKSIAKAGQRHTELVSEVNQLHRQLQGAMKAINQLEATKKAYKERLESIPTSQPVHDNSQHQTNIPRFFK